MNSQLAVKINETFLSSWGTAYKINDLVSVILSNAVIVAAILMFILMLAGGVGVIASAGSDNPEGAAKGKKMVTGAVLGFLIIFASYWIIQLVETITGLSILAPVLLQP